MDDSIKIEVVDETTIRVTKSNPEIVDYNIDELNKRLTDLIEKNNRINFEADREREQRESEIEAIKSLLSNFDVKLTDVKIK
jgi:hypothetical protein